MPDLGYLLQIIIGISLLVVAHEFGHYLAARWAGVRVDVFSIGMGKPLLQKRVGDTTFQLGVFFIGGYVKMAGDPTDDLASGGRDELGAQSVWKRIVIYVAGPLGSAVFGLLLFWLSFQFGFNCMRPRVGVVQDDSPAAAAGLKPGDVVTALDGQPIYSWEQFDLGVKIGGEHARQVTVRRGAETATLTMHPKTDTQNPMLAAIGAGWAEGAVIRSEMSDPTLNLSIHGGDTILRVAGEPVEFGQQITAAVNRYRDANPAATTIPLSVRRSGGAEETVDTPLIFDRMIGVKFASPDGNRVEEVVPGMPAEALGIRAGDRIVRVNEYAIQRLEDLYNRLHIEPGNAFTFHIERDGAALVIPAVVEPKGAALPVGLAPDRFTFRAGPVEALRWAGIESVNVWRQIRLFFATLFSKHAAAAKDNIGGPLGIFTISYNVAKEGLGDLGFILAMISINLAIVNFLPIPLLDGGQILLICLEGLKGSPIHPRTHDIANYVGLLIIVSLFIFATLNDIKMLDHFIR